MSADLAVLPAAGALEEDPVQYMAIVLNRAKSWLAEAQSIDSVRETKAIAVGYESVIREKELAFDAQLSATEIVRRCERRIGELVREGQREGTIAKPGSIGGRPVSGQRGSTPGNGRGQHLVRTSEALGTSEPQAKSHLYTMADAPVEQFEAALTSAREEGNLSRANVVRKVKVETEKAAPPDRSMAAVQQRYERIREMAAEGHTSSQIAEELGFSDKGLRHTTKKLGIDVPADAAVGKARKIDANRVVEQTVMELESQASSAVSLMAGRWDELEPDYIEAWCKSLDASLRALRAFTKRLKEVPHAE